MNTRHSLLGFDVGKKTIHVAFPGETTKTPVRQWPTVRIDYTDARWHIHLLDLVADDAHIAAEPTGHHLLAPIYAIIHAERPAATLWQADHKLTEHYRSAHVSRAKNDRLDAIALCLIARDCAAGNPPRSVHPYDHAAESLIQQLRLAVNAHTRLTKDSVRTQHRLTILGFGLWPAFAFHQDTWLRAVHQGAITPRQIKFLAAQQPPPPAYSDNRVRRHLTALAADLPDLDGDPTILQSILEQLAHLDNLAAQTAVNLTWIKQLIQLPPLTIVTARWTRMPSSSPIWIAAIHVASHGHVLDMSKDEFKSALGITPATSISGDGDHTHASKRGYRPAKVALKMWTMRLVKPAAADNAVRRYYEAVEARSFAAARTKLARVLWGIARSPKVDPPPGWRDPNALLGDDPVS